MYVEHLKRKRGGRERERGSEREEGETEREREMNDYRHASCLTYVPGLQSAPDDRSHAAYYSRTVVSSHVACIDPAHQYIVVWLEGHTHHIATIITVL